MPRVVFSGTGPPSQLAELEQELASCKEFGFDVEAHNARTFYGLTCLLQISTAAKVGNGGSSFGESCRVILV